MSNLTTHTLKLDLPLVSIAYSNKEIDNAFFLKSPDLHHI